MQKALFTLVQPAFLVAILTFWSVAPAAWTRNPLTLTIAAAVTMLLIQALEWTNERHESWRITPREFATDFFYLVLGSTAIAWGTETLSDNPLTALKAALGIKTAWTMRLPFLLQVALVVFLIEFGQYWMHRLMHKNKLFWLTHSPHHHLTQLNALKGAVGNPIELFLITLSVVAFFDLPLVAVFCGSNILAAISSFAHANVRTHPPRWYCYLFTTIDHHSLHHSLRYEDNFCNFGNSLILLDRVFGTYRDGYAEVVGQDARIRLSVWEQFVFPFRPLAAMIAARRTPAAATQHADS